MALNPPISQSGVPLRVQDEYFVLYRKDMECEVKIQNMGKYSAIGKVYMTTCRIVFVNDKFQKESFKSFDFPLAYLKKEKFEQPIFGSNYLEGEVDPLYNLLPGKTHFKLWFKSGGCQRFLQLLVEILRQLRGVRQNNRVPDPGMMENFARTQSQAYMDPNDPSIIYVQQPQLNQQSYGNTTWGIPQNKNQISPMENYYNNQQPQQPQQQLYTQQQQIGQPINYPQVNNNNNIQVGQPYNPYNQSQYQPQQYQQQNQQYTPQQQQYPPPQQQYPPPQQQYPPQQQQQYPPPQQQQQYPPSQQQYPEQQQQQQYQPPQQQTPQYQEQQPQQIQNQPQQQQQQQQQQEQPRNLPNTAYYFGFWGPQLSSNQNQIL